MMNTPKPYIRLNRLQVLRDKFVSYDETFHPGVNIIRGSNGSGKSTIAELIRYALGGEVGTWKTEAGLCSCVIAEVSLNGIEVTLRREIDAKKSRLPMSIYWGGFSEAMGATFSQWEKYPYSRYEASGKLSFSQIILNALDLPEVKGELGSNLTLHQIIRLLYVDQKTRFSDIFVDDGPFDKADLRSAVGDYVCGIFIDELYESKVQLNKLLEEKSFLKSELKGLSSILLSSGNNMLGEDLFLQEIKKAEQELEDKGSELQHILITGEVTSDQEKEASKEIKRIEKDLRSQKKKILFKEQEKERLELDIADSEDFIAQLEKNLMALNEAIETNSYIGAVNFQFCPCCFSLLDVPETPEECSLCGNLIDPEKVAARNLRMRNELQNQISESERLQETRIKEFEDLKLSLKTDKLRYRQQKLSYRNIRNNIITGDENTLSKLSIDIGYLKRKLEELNRDLELSEKYSFLQEQLSVTEGKISRLKTNIEGYERRQEKRRQQVFTKISDLTADLLRKDLVRERVFANAQSVNFDFRQGKIFTVIDNLSSDDTVREFSASSMVYLKNSFHLALHLASLELAYMRYPRFTLMDNIEDKGMEEERSHNFQRIIVDQVTNSKTESQLIFTTSMIAKELDESDLTVGEKYSQNNKSLKGFH